MMSDLTWGILGGLIIGGAVGFASMQWVTVDKMNEYETVIELCEKELPRSQRCKITAVAKIKTKGYR